MQITSPVHPRQFFVPFNAKIADITEADTNLHTLDLAAALTETRKIIAVIVFPNRVAGTGYMYFYPNEGTYSSAHTGAANITSTVIIANNTQRIQYSLSVANDDFDVYCDGYVVEV